MTRPRSSVRTRVPLSLSVTEAGTDRPVGDPDEDQVSMPWWVAATGGGVAACAVGWMVIAAVVVVGWLADMVGPMSLPLQVATQFWFSVHGGWAALGAGSWTVVPLGPTLLQVLVVSTVAGFAARQLPRGVPHRLPAALRLAGLLTVAYVLPLCAVTVLVGTPEQVARCLGGGTVLAGASALWGAVRGLRVPAPRRLPGWARRLPVAAASALGVMALVGTGALVAAVVLRADAVWAMTSTAAPEPAAAAVLVLAQLAYLPNLVLWAVSYVLGAGFTVGSGSLVSPMVTELGLLPGFPVLAALPAEGVGDWGRALWLLSGVLAGGVAAFVLMGRRPPVRADVSSLAGGLAGVAGGLLVTAVAATSRGSLGTGRLVDLGPRMPELAVMAITVMGLAGLVAGLVAWLVARVRGRRTPADDDRPHRRTTAGETESTVVLGRRH
ncbi:cell division protein PerM [Auraticoccus monumenti]|uniref:Uncharacterized protein n=1 Tax=Auraticoccus monumenti TaxID=675864 RepID=A0A1G6XND1_9ACTN|nr:DUF6350 family protein [Auraticoccus monumenti]SDD79678.1 hypothetical protein SAMN04489747_1759 [Auraticoccus monumenti]